MRLIDADALIDDIRKHSESYFADDFAHEWVDKQPTVDAVEVVRCGECRHYEKFGWCKLNDVVMQSKDFCSYGERKDG